MTLKKALEILHLLFSHIYEGSDIDRDKALKLGIETLKLINQEPPEGYTCIPRPLPGETED